MFNRKRGKKRVRNHMYLRKESERTEDEAVEFRRRYLRLRMTQVSRLVSTMRIKSTETKAVPITYSGCRSRKENKASDMGTVSSTGFCASFAVSSLVSGVTVATVIRSFGFEPLFGVVVTATDSVLSSITWTGWEVGFDAVTGRGELAETGNMCPSVPVSEYLLVGNQRVRFVVIMVIEFGVTLCGLLPGTFVS